MIPDGLASFHGGRTPLSPPLDSDMAFSSGAPPTMSASPSAHEVFSASEEQLSLPPTLPLDPALQFDTRDPQGGQGTVTPRKPKTMRIVVKMPKRPAKNGEHPVDCLLDKWKDSEGRAWFYVRWSDGSCSWEPEEHILDDSLIDDLEKGHRGLGPGVEVVRTRRTEGWKVEYRVHFLGRPKKEDEWVAEKSLDSQLVEKHRPERKGKRGRRRG